MYVLAIAARYNENGDDVCRKTFELYRPPDIQDIKTTLHDHTYAPTKTKPPGITSDPLTLFAVVFSALIHDVDHSGVTNAQLVKEGDPTAIHYMNKNVAEQNSIDIAWDLLTQPKFDKLRRHIYTTAADFKRFRQLVVNTVLATDIMDKDLKELRNKRWADAFDAAAPDADQPSRAVVNRKATVVIEHLIQASDVAHTMQHWHIDRKWNEKLFQEMYQAWKDGRMEEDPALKWYEGDLGFFDFYIIPLAKKLKECGFFWVSSDEYLSYALQNGKEWQTRGKDLAKEMVESLEARRRLFDTISFDRGVKSPSTRSRRSVAKAICRRPHRMTKTAYLLIARKTTTSQRN